MKIYKPVGDAGKQYSPPECIGAVSTPVTGNSDRKHISTNLHRAAEPERRHGIQRFTRLTNAFRKKLGNQVHALAL